MLNKLDFLYFEAVCFTLLDWLLQSNILCNSSLKGCDLILRSLLVKQIEKHTSELY